MEDREQLEQQTDVPDYDPQLLERVWARVLQGRTEDRADSPMPAKEERVPERRREPVCFGPESRVYADMLSQMLDGEWEDARIYRSLARRAGGHMGRTLEELARQERVHAGRLGAAWFILTGQQYRWSGHNDLRPPVTLPGGLREQYLQEQREAEAYSRAARQVNDPCMRTLFEQLAVQEREHASVLYSLLERM